MPFDPNAAAADTSFPGTGAAAVDATSGLSSRLSSVPVILNRGLPSRTGGLTRETGPGDTPVIVRFDEALAKLDEMTRPEIEELQRKMYSAGPGAFFAKSAYGKRATPLALGEVDKITYDAYKQLITQAARKHATPLEVLQDHLSATKTPYNIDDQASAAQAPFSPQLTNPADLTKAIKAGALSTLGVKVSDAEIAQIIAKVQASETADQRAQYDTGIAGGTANRIANPETAVEDQLKTLHPDQFAAANIATGGDDFLAMLRKVEGTPI